jgi:D-alanyl-D-alanine dipeptidase
MKTWRIPLCVAIAALLAGCTAVGKTGPGATAGAFAATTTAATMQAAKAPTVSPAQSPAEAGLISMQALVPDIVLDMRYAGSNNFVGEPIDGYEAPHCYLLEPVARALAQVELQLRAQHRRLRIYDCYRPVRAVHRFVAWARDLGDQRSKAQYYPNVDKSALVPDYIADHSGHSRGATVDLGLEQCDGADDACQVLDMGTGFDFFDVRAHTEAPGLSETQRSNRRMLKQTMEQQGFRNYPMEWWHYTFQPEPSPLTAYDVPVR